MYQLCFDGIYYYIVLLNTTGWLLSKQYVFVTLYVCDSRSKGKEVN
jgi:hypothetical protein